MLSLGHVFGRPGAVGFLRSPHLLEGPRADRYESDNPAYCCRGEAPQRLAEKNITLSYQTGLRRRP
jgi:hypothetical protein